MDKKLKNNFCRASFFVGLGVLMTCVLLSYAEASTKPEEDDRELEINELRSHITEGTAWLEGREGGHVPSAALQDLTEADVADKIEEFKAALAALEAEREAEREAEKDKK
jgi:hypothetical protein